MVNINSINNRGIKFMIFKMICAKSSLAILQAWNNKLKYQHDKKQETRGEISQADIQLSLYQRTRQKSEVKRKK